MRSSYSGSVIGPKMSTCTLPRMFMPAPWITRTLGIALSVRTGMVGILPAVRVDSAASVAEARRWHTPDSDQEDQRMITTDVYPGKDLGTLELTITDEMVQHYIKGLDEPNPWYTTASPFGGPVAPVIVYQQADSQFKGWYRSMSLSLSLSMSPVAARRGGARPTPSVPDRARPARVDLAKVQHGGRSSGARCGCVIRARLLARSETTLPRRRRPRRLARRAHRPARDVRR